MATWMRTCQECGHKQKAKPPTVQGVMSDAYRNAKCKKCKSEGSLDYGSNVHTLVAVRPDSRDASKDYMIDADQAMQMWNDGLLDQDMTNGGYMPNTRTPSDLRNSAITNTDEE